MPQFEFDPETFDPTTVKFDLDRPDSGIHADDCPCSICSTVNQMMTNALDAAVLRFSKLAEEDAKKDNQK